MGKRKVREEEVTPTTKHYLLAPQILKSRQLVDVNVLIHRKKVVKLNKCKRQANPNHTIEWRLTIDESECFDKSPEASRMKEYAISALATGRIEEDYKLVQIGPLAVGELSRRHRILHLNFKAKQLSGSGKDDSVLTYFCELTETIDSGHISVLHCIYLGPSYLLQEKADTRGCLYCSSCNIHHPHRKYSFQNGGKRYVKTLNSKLKAIDTYLRLRKHKTKTAFIKRFLDPELEYVEEKTTQVPIDRFATVALRIYNGKQGSNFELVKTGKYGLTHGRIGFVYHLNFKAMNKDDLDAGVQTFFAQVIERRGSYFLVDFCNCLGPTKSLPDKADLRGCCYCNSKSGVHHPPGPGYLTGREIDYPMERFGKGGV